MKRAPSREILLMTAPVVLLGAFGWLMANHKGALITNTGPFQPFVKSVQVMPARPVDVFDGYDTRVVVEFGARGRLPTWWEKGFNSLYTQNTGKLVSIQKNATVPFKTRAEGDSPYLDPKTGKWISVYNLKLREVSDSSGQIRLRDTLKFGTNSTAPLAKVWLDTPIRAKGVTTGLPKVSHVEAVTIESFSMDTAPRVDSQDGVARWRVKWTASRTVSPAKAKADFNGIDARINIVNAKGEVVSTQGNSSYSGADINTLSLQYKPNSDSRRAFIYQDFALDPYNTTLKPTDPLWLEGNFRSGDGWPKVVKIPFRDARGRVLIPPRTPTVPFRVLSVRKVAPNAEEVTERGADCVVEVWLKAWNPKADVNKWLWELSESSRVDSANGGTTWEFPYKPCADKIGLTYDWREDKSLFGLRYPLILKSIPANHGRLVFRTDLAANRSRRIPVEMVVRP
ncbi:hypothetical protein EON83_19780 [bacterium]|nr:MAG: hypothetical protein EON83_19780 [bacterium]